MSPPLSPILRQALASLDGDALALQTRSVADPETGQRYDIRIEVGLWRHLEDLAHQSGTTWDAVCWWTLRDFPDTPPDQVMHAFLDCVIAAARTFGRLQEDHPPVGHA